MNKYDPKLIEPHWQAVWADTNVYAASDTSAKPKYYMLTEFPYPSGEGLHAGHSREYTIGDVIARYHRMRGYNVLFPMGWDAFGLPAENFAIKHKLRPQDSTAKNIANFKRQMMSLGFGMDWSREINTTDPAYYRWTQWLFLQFYHQGLAYRHEMAINWCPKCKTGLANEEVVDGKHERCGTPVEKKLLKQWMLKITQYADRLIEGLKIVDFPPRIADQQVNWIGRSEGAEIDFAVKGQTITVYTTRPDTLGGATFLVLAPEHPAVEHITVSEQKQAVDRYRTQVARTTELAREEVERPKTGVFTGAYAKNPITGHKMPVWIADYVLMTYGTGAIMAVPAHDERDHAFAKAFDLPVINVLNPVLVRDDAKQLKEFKKHNKIVAVVENAKGEILTINWGKDFGGRLTIGGTVEGTEKPEVTAMREVAEETGYHDLELIEVGAETMQYKYYAFSKQEGHDASISFVHLRLRSQARQDQNLDESEKNKFKVEWVTRDVAEREIVEPLHKYGLEKFLGGAIFTGEGVLTNSGQFDGLSGIEAKRAVTKWLFDEHMGKGATKYRIRDWIFSRQHYWGEPIPIVHCPNCAHGQFKPKLSLSFYQDSVWDAVVAGTKTVESRAANPDEPDRLFTSVVKGDVLVFVQKSTGHKRLYRVRAAHHFDSLDAFYDSRELASRSSATGKLRDKSDFVADYASYAPDYLDRIERGGLVVWEIEPVTAEVPVPEDQLPVLLPDVDHYEPTDDGASPLAAIRDWVETTCPVCGGPAERETDTMPNWAGSSWYYLRFMDPNNDQAFAAPDKLAYWGMVNMYLGGMEHTTLHLLYSRFWHQFLYDQHLVPTPEPYAARRGQGIVLAHDGVKMSKSRGNVVDPSDIVARYGADAFRLYVLFMAPFDETTPWSDERLAGVSRFVYRVWSLVHDIVDGPSVDPAKVGTQTGELATLIDRMTHKTIKRVHHDLGGLRFNTMVSALMEYVNFLSSPEIKSALASAQLKDTRTKTLKTLVLLLAPAAPHIAEQLWHDLGGTTSVHLSEWPAYDEALIRDELAQIVVQVNGKVRGALTVPADTDQEEVTKLARHLDGVVRHLEGHKIIKTITVPGKVVNFVVSA